MSKKEKTLNLIEEGKKIEEQKEVVVSSNLEKVKKDSNSLVEAKEDTSAIEEKEKENIEIVEEPAVIEENKKIENETTLKKSHKTFFILSISLFTILLLFLLFSIVFALINSSKSTIISGVSIQDIDVSNLTKEQALEKVLQAFEEKLEQPITLKHNDYELDVFPTQFGVSFALENAVDMAYSKGRTRKYFSK